MTDNIRYNWELSEVLSLFKKPFNDLLFESHTIFRKNFDPNKIQISILHSIKTGACTEDCKYCSQSAHNKTGLQKEKLTEVETVLDAARKAKEAGSKRLCMGAAWRNPRDKDFDKIIDIVKGVKKLDVETCMTLGMLTDDQVKKLKDAGLDYYNHNIDTSEDFYDKVITTRSFQDRIDTIERVRKSGINVCSGGIIGLGESLEDRAKMLISLANMKTHPNSVPINQLVPIKGTPLENIPAIDPFDMVRMIAVSRIMMPKTMVRLSAGRESMNEQTQALCFFAGANSIFLGEKLLTTDNLSPNNDKAFLNKLGLEII